MLCVCVCVWCFPDNFMRYEDSSQKQIFQKFTQKGDITFRKKRKVVISCPYNRVIYYKGFKTINSN